jgi:hypothetical protein
METIGPAGHLDLIGHNPVNMPASVVAAGRNVIAADL